MNRGHAYRERIDSGAAGRTVLEHLAARWPRASADEWAARVERGEVSLEGSVAVGDERLERGDELVWNRPPWEEPDAPSRFEVLYEDAHVVAVAKPRGLPTIAGGGEFLERTLASLVAARFADAVPMHRLGRHTSGVVLFARSALARTAVQAAWRAGEVAKTYRALASGTPPETLTIDAPIGPVPYAPLGTVAAASPSGKPARSIVRRVALVTVPPPPDLEAPSIEPPASGADAKAGFAGERRGAEPRSPPFKGGGGGYLVDVDIETGRAHQIRIHLAFAGFPLVGDPLYGAGGVPLPGTRAVPGDGGYLLHAMRLAVRHPATGAPLVVACEPPADLR